MELNEELLINKEYYKDIKEMIQCQICFGVLISPLQCNACEHNFCKMCYEQWKKTVNDSKKICLNKCSNSKVLEAPRVVKNMINKLEFKCEYCKKIVLFEGFIKLHQNRKCIDDIIKCPFCDESKINKSQLKEYKESILIEERNKHNLELSKIKNELINKEKQINES